MTGAAFRERNTAPGVPPAQRCLPSTAAARAGDAPASNHSVGSAAAWLLAKPWSAYTPALPALNSSLSGNLPASAARDVVSFSR